MFVTFCPLAAGLQLTIASVVIFLVPTKKVSTKQKSTSVSYKCFSLILFFKQGLVYLGLILTFKIA